MRVGHSGSVRHYKMTELYNNNNMDLKGTFHGAIFQSKNKVHSNTLILVD